MVDFRPKGAQAGISHTALTYVIPSNNLYFLFSSDGGLRLGRRLADARLDLLHADRPHTAK